MSGFKKLLAYEKAFRLSMKVFEISKTFPREELFSLTDQMRRSSRSVCANIGEAYRKRRYISHFISKLTDSDAENAETAVWIDFAYSCKYISQPIYEELISQCDEIGKLLNKMITSPELFMLPQK